MVLATHIREAIANITAAKLRSFLAVLGILVGTASVVAMVSSGELAIEHALEQFRKIGTDLLAVSFHPDKPTESDEQQIFGLDKTKVLQQTVPQIQLIAPYITLSQTIDYAGHELEGNIIGATAELQDAIKLQIQQGRFLSFLDDSEYFCIVGAKIYAAMQQHGLQNPLGARLDLGGSLYTIIGVLAPWPENPFFYSDINRAVIIPIGTTALLNKQANIHNLILRFEEQTDIDKLQTAIKQFMQSQVPNSRIFFLSPKQIINSMVSQQHTFTLLLGLIGSISLLVGGIGVMNIMLVSVTERRREIGIRKAVGANSQSIRTLFLSEAVILTLFGGTLGVIIGIIISFTVAYFAHWAFHLFILPPIIGFAVSVAVGIFFGFYPAHKAAKLDPIATLRSD